MSEIFQRMSEKLTQSQIISVYKLFAIRQSVFSEGDNLTAVKHHFSRENFFGFEGFVTEQCDRFLG